MRVKGKKFPRTRTQDSRKKNIKIPSMNICNRMQSIQILIDGSHGNGTEIYQEAESESETRILISREKSHKNFHNIGHSRQIVRVN